MRCTADIKPSREERSKRETAGKTSPPLPCSSSNYLHLLLYFSLLQSAEQKQPDQPTEHTDTPLTQTLPHHNSLLSHNSILEPNPRGTRSRRTRRKKNNNNSISDIEEVSFPKSVPKQSKIDIKCDLHQILRKLIKFFWSGCRSLYKSIIQVFRIFNMPPVDDSNSTIPGTTLEDILAPRRVTNDFRWASRSWTPSPYFSRGSPRDIKEICQQVLQSEAVLNAVKETAKLEGKDETEIQKRAQDIIQEMTHNFHLYAVRWFGLVLSKLGKRLYSNIYVNKEKLDEIRSGFERYPVIFLPTHRSYVDFLLLSYVCFTYSLPLPIIAAGMDFMNMTGVAELLRKSGAFFIRRRFGHDGLYWALISEYVKGTIMQGGHPMEIFIEGTRSRTGKSLSPKTGLLTQIMELVRSREVPDVLILPISMSYDRTLEEKLYAHELLGQPKPKESTNGLLRALRWLNSQSYGSIYVNFGNFISVNEFLSLDNLSPIDDRMFNKGVRDISIQTIISHQENMTVPLFSAVATVALVEISCGKKSITLPQLTRYITSFQKLLWARGLSFGLPLASEPLESNVLYLLTNVHLNLVSYVAVDQRIWFNVDPSSDGDDVITSMQLQHYSNQLVSLIIPFCMSTLITSSKPDTLTSSNSFEDLALSPNQDHIQEYTYLRQLYSEEFVCQRGVEFTEIMFATETWNTLILRRDTNSNFSIEPINLRRCLKRALAPFLIAYWGLATTILQVGSVLEQEPTEIKEFGKTSQQTLKKKLGNKLGLYYGALSLDCMNNAVASLINSGGLARAKIPGSGAPAFTVQDFSQISFMRSVLGKYFVDLISSLPSELDTKLKKGNPMPLPSSWNLRHTELVDSFNNNITTATPITPPPHVSAPQDGLENQPIPVPTVSC